ncbi:MAG TPA: DNA polymerase/3'-5' exonuclease PolX [Acidobacteriaceae bacterium]|nr:DNA polymerase/3'-5' exonuclease PolX [Acidobacteriaceae bacterium]
MDNITIATMLDETASLLEISGGDPFRIRSYRRAAGSVEQQTQPLEAMVDEPKKLLEIPGIGKGVAANIVALVKTGTMELREELLQTYKPTMLDLLKLPSMGPKTVALVWESLGIADVDALEKAAKEGKLTTLPRFGEKQVAKLLKGIEDFRRNASRFRIDDATAAAEQIAELILKFPGIKSVTPAGSLRRGRETVGDLDLLVTGPACEPGVVSAAVEHVASLPMIANLMAKGQNKVAFALRNGMQVDVRLLPKSSYGTALQYFTGSKMHGIAVRQRALKLGYTLSEYALASMEDDSIVAAETEEGIYKALGMDWIPPELRENNGEIELALAHKLPELITQTDLRGDIHMHTTESDGTQTIREMAEAAVKRGYKYIAITDHSKNLAMTNGMDDKRAIAHAKRIRAVDKEMAGKIRIFAGVEVDILADGELDLEDATLAQLDVVIASVHTLFNQPVEQMTERILKAVENPYTRVLGHPTGRLLLKREPYAVNLEPILKRAAKLGVAVEQNASPHRLDLNDKNLRLAKELGCKFVINTDAHSIADLDKMHFGVTQLRRAGLTKEDVLNCLPPEKFLKALRKRP